MPDHQGEPTTPRDLPPNMADRLIVALDVPTIAGAREIVAKLDGIVSFFKIGLWLAFAEGVDGLLRDLLGLAHLVDRNFQALGDLFSIWLAAKLLH